MDSANTLLLYTAGPALALGALRQSQYSVMELPSTLQKQAVVTSHLLTTRNNCVLQHHTKLHSRYSKWTAILIQVVILTYKQTFHYVRDLHFVPAKPHTTCCTSDILTYSTAQVLLGRNT